MMTKENPRWAEFIERLIQETATDSHRLSRKVLAEMGEQEIDASIEHFSHHQGYNDSSVLTLMADPPPQTEQQKADEAACNKRKVLHFRNEMERESKINQLIRSR